MNRSISNWLPNNVLDSHEASARGAEAIPICLDSVESDISAVDDRDSGLVGFQNDWAVRAVQDG